MAANLSASYEKVALGAALVIALGLGATVYLSAGKLDKDFPEPTGGRKGVPAIEGKEQLEKTAENVGNAVILDDPKLPDGRPNNTFTGRPLFLKKGETSAVDLSDPSYPPVHPPVDNGWWLAHRLDPGFADALERDPDNDGFANLEEFEAETDPNDFKSHPSLIAKLQLSKLEKVTTLLNYSSHTASGAPKEGDKYKFKMENTKRQKNSSDFLEAGKDAESVFFTKPPGQLRFKLLKVEQREVKNPRTNTTSNEYFAELEDLSPNKKGDKFEVQKGSGQKGKLVRDYTATLFLDAVGQAGNNFQVEERASFALPFDADAAEKPFTFKEVNAAGDVVIEYEENGQTMTKLLPVPQ